MAGQLLNSPRRGTPHRQVRAERVPEHVDPAVLDSAPPRCPPHPILQRPTTDGLAPLVAQHQWTSQMSVLPERRGQSDGEGNVPEPCVLRRRHVTVPVGPLDAHLTLPQIDVSPLKRDHFAQPQAPVASEQEAQVRFRNG